MNHFGEFDYDRSGALEEVELYGEFIKKEFYPQLCF